MTQGSERAVEKKGPSTPLLPHPPPPPVPPPFSQYPIAHVSHCSPPWSPVYPPADGIRADCKSAPFRSPLTIPTSPASACGPCERTVPRPGNRRRKQGKSRHRRLGGGGAPNPLLISPAPPPPAPRGDVISASSCFSISLSFSCTTALPPPPPPAPPVPLLDCPMALRCCSTSPLWRRVHAHAVQPQLVIDSKRPKKANVLVEALRKTRPEFGPMWLEGVAHASRVQKSLSLSVFLSLCPRPVLRAPGLCFGVVVAGGGGSSSLSLYGTPPPAPGASVYPSAGRSQVTCNRFVTARFCRPTVFP